MAQGTGSYQQLITSLRALQDDLAQLFELMQAREDEGDVIFEICEDVPDISVPNISSRNKEEPFGFPDVERQEQRKPESKQATSGESLVPHTLPLFSTTPSTVAPRSSSSRSIPLLTSASNSSSSLYACPSSAPSSSPSPPPFPKSFTTTPILSVSCGTPLPSDCIIFSPSSPSSKNSSNSTSALTTTTGISSTKIKAKIKAHKCILIARSKYFEKLLDGWGKEATQSAQSIQSSSSTSPSTSPSETGDGDVDTSTSSSFLPSIKIFDISPEAFSTVLRFLYCGTVELNSLCLSLEVLKASDRFGIPLLHSLCEASICAELKRDNVFDMLEAGVLYNAPKLVEECIKYIVIEARNNLEEVDAEKRWMPWGDGEAKILWSQGAMELSPSGMMALIQSDHFSIPETMIYSFCKAWAESQAMPSSFGSPGALPADVKRAMEPLIPFIRFKLMSFSDLSQLVEPSALVPQEVLLEAYKYLANPNRTSEVPSRSAPIPALTLTSTSTSSSIHTRPSRGRLFLRALFRPICIY